MMKIQTDSIRDILIAFLGKDIDQINQEDLNSINDLVIDSKNENNQPTMIDFNELVLFSNLKSITISNCIINNQIINILLKIEKLEAIKLIKCDIVENIIDSFSLLKIKELFLHYVSNFDLNILSSLENINKVVLKGFNIDNIPALDIDFLDIADSTYSGISVLNRLTFSQIYISQKQYQVEQTTFDNLEAKVIVMAENGIYSQTSEGEL